MYYKTNTEHKCILQAAKPTCDHFKGSCNVRLARLVTTTVHVIMKVNAMLMTRLHRLTTAALVMHTDVLLGGAGFHVELTFALVVQPIAAAHHVLGDVLTTQRTHAFSRQTV